MFLLRLNRGFCKCRAVLHQSEQAHLVLYVMPWPCSLHLLVPAFWAQPVLMRVAPVLCRASPSSECGGYARVRLLKVIFEHLFVSQISLYCQKWFWCVLEHEWLKTWSCWQLKKEHLEQAHLSFSGTPVPEKWTFYWEYWIERKRLVILLCLIILTYDSFPWDTWRMVNSPKWIGQGGYASFQVSSLGVV